MKLVIVIVNWQTKELLARCLQSIFKFPPDFNYEIIVIDNASTDSSPGLLRKLKIKKEKLKIILNNKNLGFARAVNQGIKISKGDYLLLLNPDTEIKKRTLGEMISFMENHHQVGILGGKILNLTGTIQPSIRRFPTLFSQIIILLKLHQVFPNLQIIKKYFARDFDYQKIQAVDQVMGAFFLIRKKLLEEIGLFDEKFYLWFEEVDFCFRAKKAGWLVYYYPQAEIVHQKAASFSQVSVLKNQWQFNKSLLYFFKKHHSFFSWLVLISFIPLNLFLSLIISFFPLIKKFKRCN